MKYAVEMGSGVMIHIPNFMKNGPGIQNFRHSEVDRRDIQTHRLMGGIY
jgi:hypothetical protein